LITKVQKLIDAGKAFEEVKNKGVLKELRTKWFDLQ